MTVEEVKELLKKPSVEEAVLIGLEEDRERYYPAIIEVDERLGRVVYDYEKLAECFAEEFYHPEEKDSTWDQAMTDAYEWIDYNVIRSLPYWGEHAPVVYEGEEDE